MNSKIANNEFIFFLNGEISDETFVQMATFLILTVS